MPLSRASTRGRYSRIVGVTSMAALTALMTRFFVGKDSWLARSNNNASEPGTSEARNSNGKPRRNRHKRRNNGDNTKDTTFNAGFSGSKSG